MDMEKKERNKMEYAILIIILIGVGFNIYFLTRSLNNQVSTGITITLDEKKINEMVNNKFSNTNLEEQLKQKVYDLMISYSDSTINRIYNIVTVTSIFFTVLVVVVSAFQYLRFKSQEERFSVLEKEFRYQSSAYVEQFNQLKTEFNKEINAHKHQLDTLLSVNANIIKAINRFNHGEFVKSSEDYKQILKIIDENKFILDFYDLKDIITNATKSFIMSKSYNSAIECMERVIGNEWDKYDNLSYIELYKDYIKTNFARAKSIDRLDEYLRLLDILNVLKNNFHTIGEDASIVELNKEMYFILGKKYLEIDDQMNAKTYLIKANLIDCKQNYDYQIKELLNKIYLSNINIIPIEFDCFFNNYNDLIIKEYEKMISLDEPNSPHDYHLKISNKEVLIDSINAYIREIKRLNDKEGKRNNLIRKFGYFIELHEDILRDELDDLRRYLEQYNEIVRADKSVERTLGYVPINE